MHKSDPNGRCLACGQLWPCETACQEAYETLAPVVRGLLRHLQEALQERKQARDGQGGE